MISQPTFDVQSIYQRSLQHFLNPILEYLHDDDVTEVMVNGHADVYVERKGQLHRVDTAGFRDDNSLMAAIRNIAEYAGRHIDEGQFEMDARLPTGERVHAIFPPSSRVGPCLTIRKFRDDLLSIDQLIQWKSLSEAAAEFMELAVLLHRNVVVSGGTGTGKTTFLNALSTAIQPTERIVVIEDSSELKLQQPHTVYLEAQGAGMDGHGAVSIRELFVASLRMRPDRIVVGEVRRGEALDLVQSMISGHSGSLSTVHASTPVDAAIRLETLCLLSDTAIPQFVARTQVASAIHLVCQLTRVAGRRYVESISECLGLDENGNYRFNPLFKFEATSHRDGKIEGELVPTGNRPSFADLVQTHGYHQRVSKTKELFMPQ